MGRKGERKNPHAQRTFINEAWLSGMPMAECISHLHKHYGKDAAPAYVPMLWELRADQMTVFDAAREEPS